MWLLILSFCIGLLIVMAGAFIFHFSSTVLLACWIVGLFSPGLVVLGKLYDRIISIEKDTAANNKVKA